MSYNNITNLIKLQIDRNIKWNVESISLDGSGSMMPTYSMGSRRLYVMIPDTDTINYAKEEIDKTLEGKK